MSGKHGARRRALICWFAPALVALPCAPAGAQSWPERGVRLIVSTTTGGSSDTLARLMAPRLTEMWGHPAVVDNRPGAGGNLGTDMVAKAAPDGYTLLVGSVGPLTVNPHLFPKLPYDPLRDLAPITLLAHVANVLVVNPSVPVRNVKEFIALAKSRPGQLHFGSAGNGQSQHLAGELFNLLAGVKMVHVPYKGSAPALTDVIGGQIELTFTSLVSGIPLMRAGRLRGLAVTSATRQPAAPDLPTVAEAALPGFEVTAWFAMVGPAATPRDILAKVQADVARALRTADAAERLNVLGAQMVLSSPDELGAYMKSEIAKWGRVVREARIRAD
jgi:tripartite-type tricarboxylate transporter receptor subunit TctC